MIQGPVTIVEQNLSYAWGRAFLKLMEPGVKELQPLIVVVDGFADGRPEEHKLIRSSLDDALVTQGRRTCRTVASTLFPQSTWKRSKDRAEFYSRYVAMLDKLHHHKANAHGLYFERLIAYGPEKINQLEKIIGFRLNGNQRRSTLQASIFDPRADHSNQPRRGFPCLQHVAFAPWGNDGLAVTGFYYSQYIFERAYGNYLGLCELGQFVAQALGLQLKRMTFFTSVEIMDVEKSKVKDLAAVVSAILAEAEDN